MAKATDFLSIILAKIKALGYTHSRVVFDLEQVPSSRLDKAYRFELITSDVEELSGKSVNKEKMLSLFFAFKMKASKDIVETELINIYDFQETIEDTLLTSLNIDSNIQPTLISRFVDDYLVVKIDMFYIYRRDL